MEARTNETGGGAGIRLRVGGPNKLHKEGQKGGVSAGILISQAGASGGRDADISIQREEEGLLRTSPRIVYSG